MSLFPLGRRSFFGVLLAALAAGLAPSSAPAAARKKGQARPSPTKHVPAKHVPARKSVHARPAAASHGKPRRRTRSRRVFRPMIVLDPGHGGQDPGAIGVGGSYEKNLTLAAALELRRQLLATRRYRVALTRTTDATVELAERVAFARAHQAALLISLHADSAPRNPAARGASVYVRSGGVRFRRTRANAPDPARLSHRLQAALVGSLAGRVPLVPAPARAAHLYVLSSRIPGVLLEMGFLSNARDERALRTPAHRRRIAAAVVAAVRTCLAEPQPGPDHRT